MISLMSKTRITVLLITILIIFIFTACVTPPPPTPTPRPKQEPTATSTKEKLKVHFIKTTKMCDAILIDLGENEILIDGGLPNSGVAEYIKDHVNGPLEAMVATHPHIDHIGGLIEVLQTFDVNEIWLNGDTIPNDFPIPPMLRVFEAFTYSVEAEGAPIHEVRRGQTMDIGILSFSVLHPDTLLSYSPFQKVGPNLITMNGNSIVLHLRYGNVAFLFTGDTSKKAEVGILKAGLAVQADILKVGHHGSKYASSPRFLNSVKPKVAVYMGPGIENWERGPKKPDPETIAALKKAGAKVYGVDTDGTIIITTDGKKYTIDTEK